MNLARIYRKAFKKPMKVYWWRDKYPDKFNFGDEITPYLLDKLFGFQSVRTEPNECDLAGVGSIIGILQDLSQGKTINVWGSGFIEPGGHSTASNLTFHAVRGKLSLDRIDNKTAALGDPGLLMPLAYSPKQTKQYKLGIVPHYVDQNSPVLDVIRHREDVKIIDVYDSVEKVANDITSCELILSSSLHGLILSDAYKIPNYWMPFSAKLRGGDYKFKDYYSVFHEVPQPLAANELGSLNIEKLTKAYAEKPDLKQTQESLMKSFPC